MAAVASDAFELLSRDKETIDVFRRIYQDGAPRYDVLKVAIDAFSGLSLNSKTLKNPSLVAKYVRVLALILDQRAHIEHLKVPDITSFSEFLRSAFEVFSNGFAGNEFVKVVSDVFRCFHLILRYSESVEESHCLIALDLCEVFCGPSPQKENSCHPYIMACIRITCQLGLSNGITLGERLIRMGRVRNSFLHQEMFAFACLVSQPLSDLIAIGPKVIESSEIEFLPSMDMNLPLFRPSPEAHLEKFVSAKALELSHLDTPASKRHTRNAELLMMIATFREKPFFDSSHVMEQAASGKSFWAFVALGKVASTIDKRKLMVMWDIAVAQVRDPAIGSGACFCLSRIISLIVSPQNVDVEVVARMKSLLRLFREARFPHFTSGSLSLYAELQDIKILDPEFQNLKHVALETWLNSRLSMEPQSLVTALFDPYCPPAYLDDALAAELASLYQSRIMQEALSNGEPKADIERDSQRCFSKYLSPPVRAVTHLEEGDTLRTTLWKLSLIVKAKCDIPAPRTKFVDAVTKEDLEALVWFTCVATWLHWPVESCAFALSLAAWDRFPNVAVKRAISLLQLPSYTVTVALSGLTSILRPLAISDPVTELRSLQPLLQSYALQQSPHLLGNIMTLLKDPFYFQSVEYNQIASFLKATVIKKSPISYLRVPLAKMMFAAPRFDFDDFLSLWNTSPKFFLLQMIPDKLADSEASVLVKSQSDAKLQRLIAMRLIRRGCSASQLIEILIEDGLNLSELEGIAHYLNAGNGFNLLTSIVTPLALKSKSAYTLRLLEGFGADSELIKRMRAITELYEHPPDQPNVEIAYVEHLMKGFVNFSSDEEKSWVILASWQHLRASDVTLSSEVAGAFIKNASSLASMAKNKPLPALKEVMDRVEPNALKPLEIVKVAAAMHAAGEQALAEQLLQGAKFPIVDYGLKPLSSISKMKAEEFPQLMKHLSLSREESSFEIWKMVFHYFLLSLRTNHNTVLVERLSSMPPIAILKLQQWSGRLGLDRNMVWMGIFGQVTAKIQLPSTRYNLATKNTSAFATQLFTVYNYLPYGKKWHLHSFIRQNAGILSEHEVPLTLRGVSRFILDSNAGIFPGKWNINSPGAQFYVDVCSLLKKSLEKSSFATLEAPVLAAVPELLRDVVPLALATLSSSTLSGGSSMLSETLPHFLDKGKPALDFALRVVQRHYEAWRSIPANGEALVRQCLNAGEDFVWLGILLVELWWNDRSTLPLPSTMQDDLRSLYSFLPDVAFQSAIPIDEKERFSLLNLTGPNSWQQLELGLLKAELSQNDTLISQSLRNAGLWKTSSKFDTANFYDFRDAWWLGQWDAVQASTLQDNRDVFKNIEFGDIICFLKGQISEQTTFARLAANNGGKFSRTFHNILSKTRAPMLGPIERKGREVLFTRRENLKGLTEELRMSCHELRRSRDMQGSAAYALRLESLANEYKDDQFVQFSSRYENAKTAWLLGKQTDAIGIMRSITDFPAKEYRLGKVYCTLGEWSRKARNESDSSILENYFMKAERYSTAEEYEYVYHSFAAFCDEAYHDEALLISIEDSRRVKHNQQRQLTNLTELISSGSSDKKTETRFKQAKKILQAETRDYENLLNRRFQLSLRCITCYIKTLQAGDSYAEDMGRFIALWFELSTEKNINKVVFVELVTQRAIKSGKFVPWMNQLTSRLSGSHDYFQKTVESVVSQVLSKHPYHAAWQLINIVRRESGGNKIANERKEAAKKVLKQSQGELILHMLEFAEKMVALAKLQLTADIKQVHFKDCGTLASSWWHRTLVSLRLPVPTVTIPIIDTCEYSDFPAISSVADGIDIAGGISAPKIVTFTDSAGSLQKMVLKSSEKDDLRQDAIMQQLFTVVHHLLQAKHSNLGIRRYNVVPLDATSGAIEFVSNTRSLQDVVEPLHQEFGGNREYPLRKARMMMNQKRSSTRSVRVTTFKNVMSHTLPEMRRFWPKQFGEIESWLDAKTQWSRSNAVMSIVGYAVGLGDRHCSNLLLDTTTGEVVHIDLGIAFDQGKLLYIPETVPFRLTRDMVDGMGVCGVSGIFTSAANTTLQLLRDMQDRVMTVLEVLKHDALYTWILPAVKLKTLQPDLAAVEPEESHERGQAEVALRGVRHKLASQLSTQATVRDLIAQAQDIENLALIFSGWSPFY